MLKIKISKNQPSYFEGMSIDDQLTIINRDRINVKFTKTSNESGRIDVAIDGETNRFSEIDYNFEKFPTLKERFIKRLRYLFLKDFSIPEFQNEDIKDTKMGLLDSLDLGYGIKVSKTKPADVPNIIKEIRRAKGEQGQVPQDPNEILPKGYLPDFIYTVYFKNGDKYEPMGVVPIPFNLADEIYDLNNLDDIREFFIDLTENKLGSTLEALAKAVNEDLKTTDVTGSLKRLDNSHLTSQDIFDFYNEKSKDMSPDSSELKSLTQHINRLINRIHSGETITKADLESAQINLMPAKNTEHIKDYRKMILLAQLEKKINKVDFMFTQKIKNQPLATDLKNKYFAFKNAISDMKIKIEESKEYLSIINDINKLLENTANFINK